MFAAAATASRQTFWMGTTIFDDQKLTLRLEDDADFPPLAEFSTPSRRPSFSSLPQFQESRRSTPAIPPGLESEVASRRGTPTIPPGFSKPPTALPDLEGTGSRPSSRASIRRAASGHVMPAIPLRPGTPGTTATPSKAASRAASPSKKDDDDIVHETPTKKSRVAASKVLDQAKVTKDAEVDAQVSKPIPKENEKPAAKLGPIKAPRSVADVVKSKKDDTKKDDMKKDDKEVGGDSKPTATEVVEQQVLTKSKKGKANEEKKPVLPTPQPAKEPLQTQKEELKAVPATPARTESRADAIKRKHPGKLDIAAAVDKQSQPTSTAPADIATPNKQYRTISQPPSAPSIPASPSVGVSSPVIKTLPRTLRVVQSATPKTEAPPSASTPSAAATGKLPSRKPSVASMNFPGTPSSEHISDNMSMTSASQSRANSPPLVSRVGSAPIREKTKSQQKKDRQERAKQKEEEEKARLLKGDSIAEEPAQEAIISRKKKEKKEKAPKPPKAKEVVEKSGPVTTDTTPTVSRPVSPGPQEKETPVKVETPTPTPIRTPSMPLQSPHEPSPPPTPTLSPAQIVAELRAAKPEIQKALDSLFRTSGAASLKSGQNIIPKDLSNPASWKTDFNIKLTKDEVDALLKHAVPAIQYGGEEGRVWDRGMVTSSGAHIRALNQELERRFLDLEGALQSMPDELKWRPTKPQNETRFPSFDLEALKRDYENANARGVSVMEAMVQDGSSMKKGAFLVDEASRYINEFVMPPATPPPSVGGGSNSGRQQAGGSQQQQQQVPAMQTEVVPPPTVEQAERQLQEARKASDEKESNLKKAMRRNKKALGLGN
jgi:CCR4-NOT transcription complex subunit 4